MATIEKNLGIVTAYGYAKANGYQGTEEEFAVLMASYATVADQAAQSAEDAADSADEAAQKVLDAQAQVALAQAQAQAAAGSASEASGYKDTASAKATEASGYAADANTYKTQAQGFSQDAGADAALALQYKNAASGYADNASASATLAGNKATEASGYATTAGEKAVEAGNYADAAAGSAGEAAQSAIDAEVAATVVAESYDTTKSYNVGDKVLYQGLLYQCIEATTGAFNSSKWLSVKVYQYDDILAVIKITDVTTTMGDIVTLLNGDGGVNRIGSHVVFDVAGLNAGMYLCTIYIGDGYYRIADLVTGFEGTGFFTSSDLLKDIIASGSQSSGKHYTVQWDMVESTCVRLNDAASITIDTTNFKHSGSVNANYDNPFDDIYPWSGRKLCNIDIDLYRALSTGDDITDCVVAWEDDVNFDYEHQYGVWVYTPPFFGRSYILGNYRYFDVTDENLPNNIAYPAMITGRWHGCDVQLTIDGTSKHCNLPTTGISLANVSIANQHTYAKNYGATLVDIYTVDASALLYVVEYANLNCQTAIGNGVSELYKQGLKLTANVTDSNTITLTTTNANVIIGAIIDIGTTDGGNDIIRTYVTAVNGATVTLANAVTATTAHFVSVHGLINIADEDIGSKSGYIGANGKSNAYYRGEVLWGNKWQYILGAYRQTGTGAIWVCSKDSTDNYDALNTAVHEDTGLILPTSSSYIQTLGLADGLSIAPFCTAVGGSATKPVGDYCYVPALTAGNTVLLLGGDARYGASAGLFSGAWDIPASASNWRDSSRPHLKNPS